MVLHQIPDVPSLQCLVKASPDFHQAYLSARTEVLTAVTLSELGSKGVNMAPLSEWIQVNGSGLPDDWSEFYSLTVCTGNSKPSESALREAFLAYYFQADDPCRKRINLSIEHCNTLRTVSLFEGLYYHGKRLRSCLRLVDVDKRVERQRPDHHWFSILDIWRHRCEIEGHNGYDIYIREVELESLGPAN